MEAGMQSLIEAALQQGIWAALYIYLFFRMLKENKEREDRLSGNIEEGIEDIQSRLDAMEKRRNDA